MIKLIVFDWDDVFTLGSTEGYYACYHEAMQHVGVFLDPEEERNRIKAKWGSTIPEEFGELLKEHPDLIDKAVHKFGEMMMGDTFVNQLTLVEGGRELLEGLAKKYKLAIASGVNPNLLKEKIFPKFSIPNVFSEIITVYDLDDPTHAKPHPYMPQEIMRRLNISPRETILVGDATSDVLMAQAAGVTPVVVLTGHLSREEAENMGVEYIVSNVTHIENLPILS